jgi:AraC family transcriptional regulator
MKPRIIYRPAFTIIGIWKNGNPSQSTVDALWKHLGDHYEEIPGVDPDQGYGVHVKKGDEETYLAGLMVREGNPVGELPEGMSLLNLEANAYAVFHHTGRMDKLDSTLEKVFSKWLPDSGLRPAGEFFFEYYDDRFMPDSDDSLLFIYIPVDALNL